MLEKPNFFVLTGGPCVGKTTLLHIIAGISRPDSGKVEVDGYDITKLHEAGRDRFTNLAGPADPREQGISHRTRIPLPQE